MRPICLLNVVGLTPALIGDHTPHLQRLASTYGALPLEGVLPAVTCSAQASMLTGLRPGAHGVVGNGWYWRDQQEIMCFI